MKPTYCENGVGIPVIGAKDMLTVSPAVRYTGTSNGALLRVDACKVWHEPD